MDHHRHDSFATTPRRSQDATASPANLANPTWSLPLDDSISPTTKALTKKAALKRSAGLLNLSIEKDNDGANGVTKSFNDLNFDSEQQHPQSPIQNRNHLKRPLTSSSTPIAENNLSPFILRSLDTHRSPSRNVMTILNDEMDEFPVPLDHNKENFFVAPTKRGSNDESNSPNDSPSKPLRQKPRYNSSLVASHIFNKSSAIKTHHTSTPIESKHGNFVTPSSFKSVKPLQTLFLSSGLMSKKSAKPVPVKLMPETPCKRPSQHMLVDSNGSFSSSLSSVVTANEVQASQNSFLANNLATNGHSHSHHSINSHHSASSATPSSHSHTRSNSNSKKFGSNNSSGKKSSRSERAVNTTDLQSCLLRFTSEFDDFYEQPGAKSKFATSNSSSIFRDPIEVNHSDMEVDDDNDRALFPATPTKFANLSSNASPEGIDETPSRRLNRTKKNFISTLLNSSSSSSASASASASLAASKLHIDTVNPVNSPCKKTELTPKTPIDVLGFSNSTDSFNNMSSMMMSLLNSTTVGTDVSFSFLHHSLPLSSSLSSSCSNPIYYSRAPFDDEHLTSKFKNVQLIGTGEFSLVYSMEFESVKYLVKRTKHPLTGPKTRLRKLEEVEILKMLQKNEINDYEGHEYVLSFINCWEFQNNLYIMTEFCENGSLDKFLMENGKIAKLDEWRVWKILTEILIGLRFLHSNDILHLDLKPLNIFITFEGSLKIGDFGLLTKLPIPPYFEREGDREYIAPEVISHQQYDKPADMFSVGLIMVEIAANIILPDNGASWQKLRSGDLTDAGKLSSTDLTSYTSSVFNNQTHHHSHPHHYNTNSSTSSSAETNSSSYSSYSEPLEIFKNSSGSTTAATTAQSLLSSIKELPPWAPTFLVDGKGTLDSLVHWMINPNPSLRPSADVVLNTFECQFVELRRKCGSVIYEGDFGPLPDLSDLSNETNLIRQGQYPKILDISNSRSSVGGKLAHLHLKMIDSNDTITKGNIDDMIS